MKLPAIDARRNRRPRSLVAFVLVGATLIGSAAALSVRPGEPLDAAATNAAVTRLTTQLLENSQFARHKLDDKLAARFLEQYLDALDGGHSIFLQTDVQEFERFLPTLADATRRRGDTTPSRVIFDRYLDRLRMRSAYVDTLLKKEKFTFDTDERYVYDREEAPRPKDLAEAQKLWRQQLRYEYLQEKLAGKSEKEIADVLRRRSARLVSTMEKLSPNAVLELYLNALADLYDPHSDYMGREQLQSFRIGMNLSLVGIGAALRTEDGFCVVRELIPGGPAARSGQLKTGDRIVGVSQGTGKGFGEMVDLVDLPLPQAVDLIRGKKGTVVRLTVIPADAADKAIRKEVTLVRDEIKLEDQQAKAQIVDLPLADGRAQRIGVIDVPSFYAGEVDGSGARTSVTADVTKLLEKLKQEKVTGIVLDLRRNGGGSLEEAIHLTGLFIPQGPVVQTRDLGGRIEVGADKDPSVQYAGPLVVLTSRLSASASEILAGALQDYGRAIVVGDSSTFGKGTVQTMLPLAEIMQRQGIVPHEDPGALKVTVSKFYLPKGSSTQLKGVKADIVLPSVTDVPEIGEADLDNALPWDAVPPARFQPSGRVAAAIPALRARSQARVQADPGFAALKKDREEFHKAREAKSVSLNEAERRREKQEREARAEERKKSHEARAAAQPPTWDITLKDVGKRGLGPPLAAKPPLVSVEAANDDEEEVEEGDVTLADDLLLREAQRILADYIAWTDRQAQR